MARLYLAGAEIDAGASTATQNTGPDGANASGTPTRDTVTFRSGLASWKCDAGASNLVTGLQSPAVTFVDGRSYFFRGYVRVASAPTAASSVLLFGADVGAQVRTDGAVELVVNGVVQGSPSAAITDSNWHRVELKATATATGNWTAAELQVDGSSVATWSGSFARAAASLVWGWNTAPGANKVVNIDDIALNDSTGATNTSWPGSGKVVLLSPTADSAIGTGWTKDNGVGSPVFGAVDNTPPKGIADTTGGDGTHQMRNATSNANSSYDATMTTYTAAGVGASDTVNALVEIVATAAPVTTSAKQGTFGIVSNPTVGNVALDATGTSGAFWAGATAGTYGAGWKWSTGAMQNAPTVTKGTAPVCRVTQVTSSTRIAMCCAIFMYVDYTPAATVVSDVPNLERRQLSRRAVLNR